MAVLPEPSLTYRLSMLPIQCQDMLDRKISDIHCAKIAKEYARYESMLLHLGLTEADKEAIKQEGSMREQRLAVLRIWREKYGINATYRHLVTCFHEAKRQDMVDAVCELLSAPFTPGEMPANQKWRALYANGHPSSEEQSISVNIRSSGSGPGSFEVQISLGVNGNCEVIYTQKTRGRYEIHVVGNSEEIPASPFQPSVSHPPLHLSIPVGVIESHNDSEGSDLGQIDGLTMNASEQLIVSEKMKGEVSIWEKGGKKLKSIEVWKFLRNLRKLHVFQTPFFCRPTGVAVDKEGCIYVADNYNHCLAKFSKDGSQLLRLICQRGSREGELKSPGGIRVTAKGEVFVCDCANNRIQVFNQELQYVRSFGEKGVDNGDELKWPVDLDFDSSGHIYVSDMDNNRIQVFDAEGKFVRTIGKYGSKPRQLHLPTFLFVDRDNYLYVSENLNHRVSIFRTNGDFVQVLGGKGKQQGKMTFPKGITMDKDGFLYIGERGNQRIQIFEHLTY